MAASYEGFGLYVLGQWDMGYVFHTFTVPYSLIRDVGCVR